MSDERRNRPRRQDDRERDVVQKQVAAIAEVVPILRRAVQDLRHLAWTALAVLALVSTAAAIALTLALFHSDAVASRADADAAKAAKATLLSRAAVTQADLAVKTLRRQVLESCIRLNIERSKANLSNLADFYVDSVVLTFESRATADAKFEAAFLPRLRFAVLAKRWTPLTDCAAAVAANGVAYRPAAAVRFVDRLPPATAFDLRNAAEISPAGSVRGTGFRPRSG